MRRTRSWRPSSIDRGSWRTQLRGEPLERRELLAGVWQNALLPCDVDGSGFISLNDALLVVAELREQGIHEMPGPPLQPPPYFDVDGNNIVSLNDVLEIVIQLRAGRTMSAPEFTMELERDTAPGGAVNADHITSDPTVVGRLSLGAAPATTVVAVLDGGRQMLANIDAQGEFRLASTWPVDGSADGPRTLRLYAQTYGGPVTVHELSFTLDTQPPASVMAALDAISARPADPATSRLPVVWLAGQTEAGAVVEAVGHGIVATADAAGLFALPNVALALGQNSLQLRASDQAGNSRTAAITIERVAEPQPFPLEPTVLRGQVVDEWGAPLAGVPIQLAGQQATTDATGWFTITLPEFVVPTDALPIAVPTGDPLFDPFGTGLRTIPLRRAIFDPATGDTAANPRRHVNVLTSWIDASMVYGSDDFRALALRTLDGTGRLKATVDGLLPLNSPENFPGGVVAMDNPLGLPNSIMFAAGDSRANENPALAALHTLLVREHNRRADAIAAADPALDDEEIFQRARRWVSALVQQITYQEFLPLLIGAGAMPDYTGYDPTVDPSISPLFSTAAFRLGHTLLPEQLPRLDAAGQPLPGGALSLRDSFFDPRPLVDDGIEPFLRGLIAEPSQRFDAMVVDGVRNFLFGPPGAGGLDLVSLNIQRGRDMGLPTYNETRVLFGLPAAATFGDITSDAALATALASVYASVDDVELWVGGLVEDPVPGAALGATFRAILVDQFARLRDGDRFWYENGELTAVELHELRGLTLADIIVLNTNIDTLPASVFTSLAPPAGPAAAGGAAVDPPDEVRSYDGSGNNLSQPLWGRTGTLLRDDFLPAYGDGAATPAGADRPSPRAISNAVHAQTSFPDNGLGMTALLVFWGQLLDHDISLTPGGADDTLRVRGDLAGGLSNLSFKLADVLGHDPQLGVENRLRTPLVLPVAGGEGEGGELRAASLDAYFGLLAAIGDDRPRAADDGDAAPPDYLDFVGA